MDDWDRGEQGIVFEVLLLSERQKKALLILWDHKGATGKKRCTHSPPSLTSSMRTEGKGGGKGGERSLMGRKEGVDEERTATDVKKKWITRQTHHRGRSSAPRATGSVRLCSIANVDIVLFCACESVTMQMRRKQIFMTTF